MDTLERLSPVPHSKTKMAAVPSALVLGDLSSLAVDVWHKQEISKQSQGWEVMPGL